MPRNSNGVYSLPQAAFQANTVIASAAMNSNLSDIAQALTQSMATTGVTSMSGQFLAASGSVGAPGISFASQTNSGLYLAGANQIGFATNGTQAFTVNSDQTVTFGGANFNTYMNVPNVFEVLSSGNNFNWGSTAVQNNFYLTIAGNADVVGFIDGGGAPPTVGYHVWIRCPFKLTVYAWRIAADQVGSAVVDVGGQQGSPVSAPSIIGAGNHPSLSSQQFNFASVSGWSQTVFPSDFWLNFYVDSASTVTKLNITLLCTRGSAG